MLSRCFHVVVFLYLCHFITVSFYHSTSPWWIAFALLNILEGSSVCVSFYMPLESPSLVLEKLKKNSFSFFSKNTSARDDVKYIMINISYFDIFCRPINIWDDKIQKYHMSVCYEPNGRSSDVYGQLWFTIIFLNFFHVCIIKALQPYTGIKLKKSSMHFGSWKVIYFFFIKSGNRVFHDSKFSESISIVIWIS